MFLQSDRLSWTVHPELESFCKHRLNFLLNLYFILVSIFSAHSSPDIIREWDICHFFTNSFLLLFIQSFGYIPEYSGSYNLGKCNLVLLAFEAWHCIVIYKVTYIRSGTVTQEPSTCSQQPLTFLLQQPQGVLGTIGYNFIPGTLF